jgi:hypothetical protein
MTAFLTIKEAPYGTLSEYFRLIPFSSANAGWRLFAGIVVKVFFKAWRGEYRLLQLALQLPYLCKLTCIG